MNANPPVVSNEDRSSHVVGSAVVLIILPTVTVILRLLSRWMSKAGLWIDDYTVILSLIISWGPNIVNILAVRHGFGKHMNALPTASVFHWFKYLYAFEFLYTLGMAAVKYSILCFMYRIFPIVQFRRILKASLVFVIALTIACVIVSIFQCIPVHKFWETLGGELAPQLGGRCINVRNYFVISGSINTFTDFALLAMPIPILWRLRTGKPQKLLLTGIFTVGLTVCAVSVVRLVILAGVDQSDITWNYVPAATWSAAEPSVAVVSACLPSLRPLFVRLIWGGTHRPKPVTPPRRSVASWRSKSVGGGGTQGSFNRLQELSSDGTQSPWRQNSVAVIGGKADEEYGTTDDVPWNRIRAKTEVVLTISERVDWKDDLF
ncbi:MAG: hypothetical protein L6R38_005729 [Xanthoria sp. 2 TBL-2021]|nr:MAG: hypothetical protein L6R38_005729 [Xanthoria sp. 2 TBL-2021]